MAENIAIERVDHIGVRVRNLDRALGFYRVLGFAVCAAPRATMSRSFATSTGVELNLVFNANAGDPATQRDFLVAPCAHAREASKNPP
jgi:catechol 2,3-dioxygenase-like lactoylglutathione lyase family enzyme